MPSFRNLELTVVSNEVVIPNIHILKLKPDQKLEFRAGQYISIKVGERINRAYSIASAPSEEVLELVVDIAPSGPGSLLVQSLKKDDVIKAMAPFGFFTLEHHKISSDQKLVFLCTGTGIAPFRSMINDLLQNGSNQQIELYFGLRYNTETYYFEELRKHSVEYPNFKFIPVISRPDDNWKGATGHIQDNFQYVENDNSRYFICGRSEVVKSINEFLINQGIPQTDIFFEKFG